MSDLVSMKFFKPHGVYVAGDIAGFSTDQARKLKSVARPYDADAEKEMEALADAGDVDAVKKMIAGADQEFHARAADLAEREAKLAEREAALSDAPNDSPENIGETSKGKGKPPAQGGKSAASES